MPFEDLLTITGRGTVATGRIETGIANTGDAVDIIGMGAEKLTSTVTGVEMFRKILDRGEAGDNVGILLRGIEKAQIQTFRNNQVVVQGDGMKHYGKQANDNNASFGQTTFVEGLGAVMEQTPPQQIARQGINCSSKKTGNYISHSFISLFGGE